MSQLHRTVLDHHWSWFLGGQIAADSGVSALGLSALQDNCGDFTGSGMESPPPPTVCLCSLPLCLAPCLSAFVTTLLR